MPVKKPPPPEVKTPKNGKVTSITYGVKVKANLGDFESIDLEYSEAVEFDATTEYLSARGALQRRVHDVVKDEIKTWLSKWSKDETKSNADAAQFAIILTELS